jgi:hypothetical protein
MFVEISLCILIRERYITGHGMRATYDSRVTR